MPYYPPTPTDAPDDHATLTNVTSDQHHAQSHAHVSHTGIAANDHHVSFVQADHDALANPHHSNANDHAQSHTHASHTGIGIDDHHARDHSISGATHTGTLAHSALGSVTADQHHNQNHSLIDTTGHPASGLTIGNVVRATGATAYAFQQLAYADLSGTPTVPSPATTVTGPDAFGASAVVGTGTSYARNDHDHGLPASSVSDIALSLMSPSIDEVITAGYSAVIADWYEMKASKTTEIGALSVLHLT